MNEDGKDSAREAVGVAHRNLKAAEKAVAQAIVDARHVKVTWREIAEELGIAQPNATRKYKPFVDAGTPRNLWPNEVAPQLLARAAVRMAYEAHQRAEMAELQAVAGARTARVAWGDIAAGVEMLESNAIVKFRPLLVEERTVSVRADALKR
ncbi:hypothetical protein [Nonomuraea sp. NPDC052265]|uniref:hypothetical protein n=1 Tax=Nonomuraea sp. NPDC052265 TaxID=3364374 RepID=UPI0037CB23BD